MISPSVIDSQLMLHKIIIRHFSTTSNKLTASPYRIGRFLNKVMNRELCPPKPTYKEKIDTLIPELNLSKNTTHRNRRVIVLNKLFMKNITDLLSTGEVAPYILGKGVEISHVQVAPDIRCVNVHWHAPDTHSDKIESILKQASGHLQSELSKLRIIGVVPPIHFVKNKQLAAVKEVEKRLASIDFGEDYTPTGGRNVTKQEFTIRTSLPDNIKQKIEMIDSMDDENKVHSEDEEIDIPAMKHDVLGLNHYNIMQRVKESIKRVKTAERNRILNIQTSPQGNDGSVDISSYLDIEKEEEIFSQFIKKRVIEQKRKRNALSIVDLKREEVEDNYSLEEQYAIDDSDINKDELIDECEEIENCK